ncbi:MAG: hypothetical protein IT363_06485 [Methanoregulaceae archaeon]|nr:hypothetical protein [Methanoregulaceae archaeon]
MRATVLVRRAGEAALPVKVVLARPDRMWIQAGEAVTRGNGQVIEQVSGGGSSQSSIPSTQATLLESLSADYLQVFRLFFLPDADLGVQLKQQVDDVRGTINFKVFDLSEKSRPGKTARLFVDPRDWLPREVSLSWQGSELTRVLISEIATDTDVSQVDFGSGQTATKAGAIDQAEKIVRVEDFPQPHTESFPLGTILAFTGPFPPSLSKHRAATLNVLIDGVTYSSLTISGDWVAKWKPQSPDGKKYQVQVEVVQGSDRVLLGRREIEIKKHWTLEPQSIQINDDGLAVLQPSHPLREEWDQLKFHWNGSPVKTWMDKGRLVMEGPRLLPGLVTLSGQMTRKDGSQFQAETMRLTVAPAFTITVPIDTCRVDLNNADQLIKLELTRTLPGVTFWRVWLNGIDVLDGKGSPGSPTMDLLVPGKNELVLELVRGRTSFFSQAHSITAEVDVAVQRRQVAEVLLRLYRVPLTHRLAVLLKLQDQLPGELTDPQADLPSVRGWQVGMKVMKEIGPLSPPKTFLTVDPRFNDEAKAVETGIRDLFDYCLRNAELLSFAYGDGQQVKNGGRLEDTLRAMLQALDNSRGATASAKTQLKMANAFFKTHGRQNAEPFSRESERLDLTGEGSKVTHYHRVCLQAVGMIAAGVDSEPALAAALGFVQGNSDAPYRAKLVSAIGRLREVIKLKYQLSVVMNEIRLMERALDKATSKEERNGIAEKIANLRVRAERLSAAIALEQVKAWEEIEAGAAMIHVNLSSAFEKARK